MIRFIENQPAIEAIRAKHRTAIANYAICDSMSDFADACETVADHNTGSWGGGMTNRQAIRALREGDLSGVADAEKFMASLKLPEFETAKRRVVSDIVGGVADVPSFLCGHPIHMRRSHRMVSDQGALCIIAGLTSSGGINAAEMRKRGCVILALVQMLSAIRPVELWVHIGLGGSIRNNRSSSDVCVPIATAPMDLARAAHMLTHPAIVRGLGYQYLHNRFQEGGAWNYGDFDLYVKHAREIYMGVLPHASDVLYVPPVISYQAQIGDPTVWLNKMVRQYGGANNAIEA